MRPKNIKSVLFIFEGYTEKEFYDKIFRIYLPNREICLTKHNLKGTFSINKKVRSSILTYLSDKKKSSHQQIHVIVAYDREGKRETETSLDIELLKKDFKVGERSRIKSINEIIATQDLESWLFHDIENIYVFLRVPKKERQPSKFQNVELHNNKTLSKLFREYDKFYVKRGNPIQGFIDHLDLKKIYNKTPDLQEGINFIISLCK